MQNAANARMTFPSMSSPPKSTLQLNLFPQVIPGWDQGLLGVCKGEERHLVVPSSLAYGDRGAGDVIPPDATLLFDIVVVDVVKAKSAEDLRREKEEEERRRAAAAAKEAEAARRRAEQEEAERRKVFRAE